MKRLQTTGRTITLDAARAAVEAAGGIERYVDRMVDGRAPSILLATLARLVAERDLVSDEDAAVYVEEMLEASEADRDDDALAADLDWRIDAAKDREVGL